MTGSANWLIMMRYNFQPKLTDHAQLLILVRPFFNASDHDFQFILNKLCLFTYAQLHNSERNILLKFTKGYNRESLEWGRLQLHRRPVGFIGVARLSSDSCQQRNDYLKIETRFGNLTSQYESYLFDSRCIVIGPEKHNAEISRKDILYVSDAEDGVSEDITTFLTEFVSSIYVILESKRVEKLRESLDKMSLPTAPVEQLPSPDADNRFLKRRLLGRNRKILADLFFLGGYYQEAMYNYTNAAEHLRSVGDYLWLGSALEGMCAVSWTMHDGGSLLKGSASFLKICYPDLNINVNIEPSDEGKAVNTGPLSHADIVQKYTESLACYKKYQTGPVEIEGHLKLIRVLLFLKRTLDTCQVVQSLLVLPLCFNDNEKIEFSTTLAAIHEEMKLPRKAAFYKRRAALYCVHQQSSSKIGLARAIKMLTSVAEAHNIVFDDPQNYSLTRGSCKGWPAVQLRVLLDMMHVSRKLGNDLDSVRILCYVLEKHLLQLTDLEKVELIELLEDISDDGRPLSNQSQYNPGIQLLRPLPIVRNFKPKKLARYLHPLKLVDGKKAGPFIFSSLCISKKKEEDIIWVCNDVSEVVMLVDNPLPAEIKVNKMMLLTEGVVFEAHPATLALPSQSGCFPFMLLGTPKEAGKLYIKGYTVEVFGIVNVVTLPSYIEMDVTPALPLLRLSCTLPQTSSDSPLNPEDEHYQTLFTSASLYKGHSCDCKLSLENVSRVPITMVDIKMVKPSDYLISFDVDQMFRQLPIDPGCSAVLDVQVMPLKAWRLQWNIDRVEIKFVIQYSGASALEHGYVREGLWVNAVKVMPSLELKNFSYMEIEQHQSCCSVVCDAVNLTTSLAMRVSASLSLPDGISSSVGCSILDEVDLLPKKSAKLALHVPRFQISAPDSERKSIQEVYEQFLREAITFHWRLIDTSYSGVACVKDDLKVSPSSLGVLRPKHVKIDIVVNDSKLCEGEEVQIRRCHLMTVHVALTNDHEQSLENLVVNIDPYQQCVKTVENIRQLFSWTGILTKTIQKLAPGEMFHHSFGLIFFYDGEFVVDVSCSPDCAIGSVGVKRRGMAILERSVCDEEGAKSPFSWSSTRSSRAIGRKKKKHESSVWARTFRVRVL